MTLVKNKRLTLIIVSILLVFGTSFTDLGYYMNDNQYNTFTRDYGFPAAWLILSSDYEYRSLNILGLLFNFAFFYLILLLIHKLFTTIFGGKS
ncbi:hypothetical protein [Aureibacillus halotolerans]|uniref:YfzA-like protein n=1 Tax=Aureibacillus halotolerans TaxID=1508390 RepID=A0A4R6TTK8_9BACI|nr:hypothetical protein [Aureibacillus halotolerans]TDQ35303.1 hypothetical protein EV213_12290 [Aureibacillus halotolerans]